jgi:hypothetical protein
MTVEYVIRDGRRSEVETIERAARPKRRREDPHIGCPVGWLKRVIPLLKTPEQVGVAIWLHRRQAICRKELFTVPSKALQDDLGLSREIKNRTLAHLEEAEAIALVRDGKRALQVRFLW